jgi:hypothetical protein
MSIPVEFVKLEGTKVVEHETYGGLLSRYEDVAALTDKEKLSALAKLGYYPLSDKPDHLYSAITYNRFTEWVHFDEVKVVKGFAVPKWVIEPLPEEEVKYLTELYVKSIRQQRDKLLAESDWTQVEDVPEEIKLKWRGYRQALRELPNTFLETKECVWPIPPV